MEKRMDMGYTNGQMDQNMKVFSRMMQKKGKELFVIKMEK
jgi:hypothetical protein